MELLINCFDWINFLVFIGVVGGAIAYLGGVLWLGYYLEYKVGEWAWIPVLIVTMVIPIAVVASIVNC